MNKIRYNLAVNPSSPGFYLGGGVFITASISVLVMDLFDLSVKIEIY